MSGGSISNGRNADSGKVIEPTENVKWRKRFEAQVAANNLLQDRLRKTREWSRNAMAYARKHMAKAQADIVTLRKRVIELEARMVDEDSK